MNPDRWMGWLKVEGWANEGAERGNWKGWFQESGWPADGDANLGLRAKKVPHVVELEFVFSEFHHRLSLDISYLSQTSRRRHTWTLQSTLNCHMRLFLKLVSLLTSTVTGQFGLHQNLIKFYCAVKCFSTALWIILPDPNTMAQFRVVIKKSLNVIKPVWQQGMK